MKTNNNTAPIQYGLRASVISEITRDIEKLAARLGSPLIVSDWKLDRPNFRAFLAAKLGATTMYIAVRAQGVEFGTLQYVEDRCAVLGSALVTYAVRWNTSEGVYEVERTEVEQEQEQEQAEPIEATADAVAVRYTIYIGLNDSTTRRQEVSTAAARGIVANAVRYWLGNGTITEATGVYTHDDGEAVTERTLVVTATHDKPEAVNAFAEAMRDALHQECVYIERDTVAPYYL